MNDEHDNAIDDKAALEKATCEAAIEREQIEQVFMRTCGELADEPWELWFQHRLSDGEPIHKDVGSLVSDFYPGRFHYWYEGVPDYAESESGFDVMKTYRTAITWGGGFLGAPDPEMYDGDGVWKLVASYSNSGETECLARTYDPISHEDHQGREPRRVTTEEAKGSVDEDRCMLCEEEIGEEHGYIYIGEGYEAVYELHEQRRNGRTVVEILNDESVPSGLALRMLASVIYDDETYMYRSMIRDQDVQVSIANALWRKLLEVREVSEAKEESE